MVNFFLIGGLALIIYGAYLNPIKKFNARRVLLLGIASILAIGFGTAPLLLASSLFLMNKSGKFVQRRLWYALPIILVLLFPDVIESMVLRILPNQVENALMIGIAAMLLVMFVLLQNEALLKRRFA